MDLNHMHLGKISLVTVFSITDHFLYCEEILPGNDVLVMIFLTILIAVMLILF